MKTNKIIKLISLFSILLVAGLSLSCEKSTNIAVFEWSAAFNGVNYNFSTTTASGTSSNGGSAVFITSPISGTQNSTLVLSDDGGWPQFNFGSGSTPFTVGTYILDSQSSGLPITDIKALTITLSPSNLNSRYSTLVPNARLTLNITSIGNAGGIVEGNFSGTVGSLFDGSLVNISGTFKAYRS